jgi:excisionase family DNA binding protein
VPTYSSAVDSAPAPNREQRRHPNNLPSDVALLPWAAEQLGISKATAYRLAAAGRIPGLFRVGGQYRVSVPRFLREVHGEGA